MRQKNRYFLILLLVAIFSIISIPKVFAQKSNNFVLHVASKIYSDCKNSDIELGHSFDLTSGESIDAILTPIDPSLLLGYLVAANQTDFYEKIKQNFKNGAIVTTRFGGIDGSWLVSCDDGGHYLDIEGDKWFWDGEIIELPKTIQNNVTFNGDVIDSAVAIGDIPTATVNSSPSTTTASTTPDSDPMDPKNPLSIWGILFKWIEGIGIAVVAGVILYFLFRNGGRGKTIIKKKQKAGIKDSSIKGNVIVGDHNVISDDKEEIKELNKKMHDLLVKTREVIKSKKKSKLYNEIKRRLSQNAERCKKYDLTIYNDVNFILNMLSSKEKNDDILINEDDTKELLALTEKIGETIDKIWSKEV